MKAKKVLCLILTLCLILGMLPTVTFAEGEVTDASQVTAGYVARIGDEGTGTYYKTLKEAVSAVTQSNLTVTLIADATIDSTITLTSAQDGVAIDGNGKTITHSVTPAIRTDGYDVTIKNATIVVKANRLFSAGRSTEDVTCTLDNCTVTAGSNYLFNAINAGTESTTYGKVYWVVKNSTVTLNGSETWMYCHEKRDVTLTLDNTVVKKTVTKGNDAVFNAQNLSAFTLNLKNGSAVTIASTKTGATYYAIHMTGGVNSTLNFDAGTKLIFDSSVATVTTAKAYTGNGTVTVNDGGVEYILNSASTATTLSLPALDGKIYQCNGVSYTNNIDVSKLDRTSALTFKSVTGVIGASNDTEAVANGYNCRIGAEGTGKYYASLSDAFSALKDNDTIALLADATSTGISVTSGGKTFTLDGNGHKLTATGDAFTLHDCKSTFKNLTLQSTATTFVLRVQSADSLTMNIENCTITSSKMVFKCQTYVAKAWQYVNIKNSTITSGTDDWMLGNDTNGGGQYIKFTFDNSTAKTTNSNGTNNYSMFIVSGSKEKKLEVHVTNGSHLIAGNGNTDAKATKNYIFSYGDTTNNPSGTFDLYLDKTAVLELAPKATNIVDNRFVSCCSNVTATLHDEGATWKISKEAIAQGAYYCGFDNAELIGWAFNSKLYAPVAKTGIGVIDKTLTVGDDGLTISPVFLNANDFYMVDGASIRLEGPTGIRFKTRVSNDLLDLLGENVTFGTYIAPTSKLSSFNNEFKTLIGGGSEGSDYVKVDRTKWALTDDNGENEYRSVLYGLTEDKTGYTLAISAMSFMEITYADNTYKTFYTAYSDANNSRSMNDVATSAISAGETTAYLQSIVDACK